MSNSTTKPVVQPPSEKIIIRFSQAWWVYMLFQGGALRSMVNGLEDTLAITGRTFLLIFLLYCGVKSGALLVKPDWTPSLWLEMSMFLLQLAGLEGSMPGLSRHAMLLRDKRDFEGADKVEVVMKSARVMTVLTIGEGVLHLFGLDTHVLQIISGLLLLVRGVVITSFLMELAKIEAKGPRVLSRAEHVREEQARLTEGKQAQTIADLQAQLEKMQKNESEQVQVVASLQSQVKQFEDLQTANCRTAELQSAEIHRLQTELQTANLQLQTADGRIMDLQEQYRLQSADLQTCNLQMSNLQIDLQSAHTVLQSASLQIADLTAKLQAANQQIADLQKTEEESADLQTSQQSRITSIETARAKHEVAGVQSRKKMDHADVVAFMQLHPGLKRTEIAEKLQISERKVYDAVAWQKEQQSAVVSAK